MTALQDQLDEITANTRRLVQAERLAVSERAVRELFNTGIEEKILPVSAQAPEFILKDASGRPVRSADLLALGPEILGQACVSSSAQQPAQVNYLGNLNVFVFGTS